MSMCLNVHMSTCPYGHMDMRTDGHMDMWTYGHMDIWTFRHMEIKERRTIVVDIVGEFFTHMFCRFYTFCHSTLCHFIPFVVIRFVFLYLLSLYLLYFYIFISFCRYMFCHYMFCLVLRRFVVIRFVIEPGFSHHFLPVSKYFCTRTPHGIPSLVIPASSRLARHAVRVRELPRRHPVLQCPIPLSNAAPHPAPGNLCLMYHIVCTGIPSLAIPSCRANRETPKEELHQFSH
jgi:hypothetical protein